MSTSSQFPPEPTGKPGTDDHSAWVAPEVIPAEVGAEADSAVNASVPAATAPRVSRMSASLSRRRLRAGMGFAAAVVVGAGAGAGVTAAAVHRGTHTIQYADVPNATLPFGSGSGSGSGAGSATVPSGALGDLPGGGAPPGTRSSVKASAVQSAGVVDIDTVDGYQGAEAAGTGLVLTSSGEILTNNHVIDGATKISVTVVTTGTTYTARVVGTSPTKDIAVLRLVGAAGLQTTRLGDSSSVTVGETVTGVGNAGGVGGTPSAARGTVTALDRTITAADESGSGPEKLAGMIVTNAPIASGDSGGPLYDSTNKVVGIDTAASSSIGARRGYAIPINRALLIAHRIERGPESSIIHLGYPAFLGIALSQTATRAVIGHVYRGSPAARAGLNAGDTITAVDDSTVKTYHQLRRLILIKSPGETVSITYTGRKGSLRTLRVTLTSGPAD